ncbi:hypothetical protein IXO812_20910, partial [Xanthomonas oryzae pv. oryzae]
MQCPWDIVLHFLTSVRGDGAGETRVGLIAVDHIRTSLDFFSDPQRRLICIDAFLIALTLAESDTQSVISTHIFGALVIQLRIELGDMPGSAVDPRFSLSRYMSQAESDPYYQILKKAFTFTEARDGTIEAKYIPLELAAAVRGGVSFISGQGPRRVGTSGQTDHQHFGRPPLSARDANSIEESTVCSWCPDLEHDPEKWKPGFRK